MRKSWLINICVAVVGVCASLTCAEFVVRRYVPEVSDTFIVQLRKADEKYHHNSINPASIPAPNPSAYRVMFIGDSFTYGICGPEETFPRLVERYFTEGSVEGVPPLNVQSLNLGIPSYSPSIYGALLRDFAPVFKPHLVVLAVDDSDPQDDYLYRNFLQVDSRGLPVSVYPGMPGVPTRFVDLARKVKLLRLFFAATTSDEEIRDEQKSGYDEYLQRSDNRLAHYHSDPAQQANWNGAFARSLKLIDAFFTYCQEHTIKVVLINYPYPPVVTKNYCREWRKQFGLDPDSVYSTSFHDVQRQLAQARGVPYYDFTPYLRSYGDLKGFYNEGDGHFTDRGNDHLARELVRFIHSSIAPQPPR